MYNSRFEMQEFKDGAQRRFGATIFSKGHIIHIIIIRNEVVVVED